MNEKKIEIAERMLRHGFALMLFVGKSPIHRERVTDPVRVRAHLKHRQHANAGVLLPDDVVFVDVPAGNERPATPLFVTTPSGGRIDFVLRSGCTDRIALARTVALLPKSTLPVGRYEGSNAWTASDPFWYVRSAIRAAPIDLSFRPAPFRLAPVDTPAEITAALHKSDARRNDPKLTGDTPAPFWIVLAEDHEAIFPDRPYSFARIPTEAQAFDLAAELAKKHRRVFHVLRRTASVSLRVT